MKTRLHRHDLTWAAVTYLQTGQSLQLGQLLPVIAGHTFISIKHEVLQIRQLD